MSDEASKTQKRFPDENFPRLKPIEENGYANEQVTQKQTKTGASPVLPPIRTSIVPGLATSISGSEPPGSVSTSNKTFQDTVKRHLLRHNSTLSIDSSQSNMPSFRRTKRASLYDHVHSKIDSGLQRPGTMLKKLINSHQLGPTYPIKWTKLQHDIENDASISVQAQQLEFHAGVKNTTLLNAIITSVKAKVKQSIASIMGISEERYKIVVHASVFPKTAIGLCIASRCLWNTSTDGSITVQMNGVDCSILITVYVLYTDLGAL